MFPPRPTHLAHQILADVIREGSTVIDATAGNGYDTLFLAERVGASGKVLAFDIQESAISAAGNRLAEAGLSARVTWHRVSHARMVDHAEAGSVSLVMFNLGYLPGEGHEVTTCLDETLLGLAAAELLLGEGGVMSVVCYPGHDAGNTEAKGVECWMSGLTLRGWRLAKYQMLGTRKAAPFLLAACRI